MLLIYLNGMIFFSFLKVTTTYGTGHPMPDSTNPSIYNIIQWFAGPMGKASDDVPMLQ